MGLKLGTELPREECGKSLARLRFLFEMRRTTVTSQVLAVVDQKLEGTGTVPRD